MNVTIIIDCCTRQEAKIKNAKKTREEIEAEVLKNKSTFPCALCGKRKKIEEIVFD